MRNFATFIALAFLASTAVLADEPQIVLPAEAPGKPDFRIAKSGAYVIDPDHSQVLFTVKRLGFTHYTGQFTHPTGTLDFDARNIGRSKVAVSFVIAKVRTTSTVLDAALNGPDYFDPATFPVATFVSTRVRSTGLGRMIIDGDLTIKGATHPVSLEARFVGAGQEFWGDRKEAIGFMASGRIKRSAFGMGANVAMVSDDVELVINVGFEAK